MMFLDTEFNSFHGQLISMGIITEGNHQFYEVLELPANVHPWVAEHVVPVLNKAPVRPITFKARLWAFMHQHQNEVIIADWPEDIAHLMWWLCGENGTSPKIQLTTRLINSGKFDSDIPHNALADAMALKEWYMNQ
jgi:hypothetical protein